MMKFCSLFSGSSGNAVFISSGNTKVLVDAGMSKKRIENALNSIGEEPSSLSAILVSHEHRDHILGVGIMSRKYNLPIYANRGTWESMESIIGKVEEENKRCFENESMFDLGDLIIKPFQIPHDASEPIGYRIHFKDKKITIATDIGHINKKLLKCIENSDILLLEANHDIEMLKVGSYPYNLKRRILSDIGHLSNEVAADVVSYLANKGAKNIILGHLSKENNFPELAYETVACKLYEDGIKAGRDINLVVAGRDSASDVLNI